jgi:hypothetical protein
MGMLTSIGLKKVELVVALKSEKLIPTNRARSAAERALARDKGDRLAILEHS